MKLKINSYNIYFEKDFDNLINLIKNNYSSNIKICIITDSNLGRIYLNEIKSAINNCYTYVFEAGEKSKNFNTYLDITRYLINEHFSRNDILIALGGGVVGDMCGFVAATYMRGIKYIQVPTTLLSMIDSSIGSKTAINLDSKKNILGSFKDPTLVYQNLNTLSTLDDYNILSGYAEVIKHGLIYDKEYFYNLPRNLYDIKNNYKNIIYRSCEIKRDVVLSDPYDKGKRAILNFGHTFGHAIEANYSKYLSHGMCIALGILIASHISYQRNNLNKEELNEIFHMISLVISNNINCQLNSSIIKSSIIYDKKISNNKINWILLSKIGSAYKTDNVREDEIDNAIKTITKNFPIQLD